MAKFDLLIKGGLVVDTANNREGVLDVAVAVCVVDDAAA